MKAPQPAWVALFCDLVHMQAYNKPKVVAERLAMQEACDIVPPLTVAERRGLVAIAMDDRHRRCRELLGRIIDGKFDD